MDSSNIRSLEKTSTSLKRLPVVTQAQLAAIAGMESAGRESLQRAREERAKVLEALEAGAIVEPGRYSVSVRTRPRRKKP